MKAIIELDQEIIDKMLIDELIRDYRVLNDEIMLWYEKYENNNEDIPSAEHEKNIDIRYRDALEIVLEYYLPRDEYKKMILEEESKNGN